MGVIREQSDKICTGATTIRQFHPMLPSGEQEEVAAGVMFQHWFANVTAARTREGLVLIDTGAYFNQERNRRLIRKFSPDRINTAIYTHGHVDHACGMPAIVAEPKNKVARPRVVGHRAVAARFDRYKRTIGYNNTINTRQFSRPRVPTEYVYPDTYFDNQFNAVAGDHVRMPSRARRDRRPLLGVHPGSQGPVHW